MRRGLKHSSFMAGFTDSYLADLGRVVAAWAHVEMNFDMMFLGVVVMLGKGAGSANDPRFKMMGEAFERRIRAFRARIDELEMADADRKRIEKILDQLVQLRSERDAIAHARFSPKFVPGSGFVPDTGMALVKSWRNQKPHERKEITRQYLKKTFEKTHTLYWDLVELSLDQPWSPPIPRGLQP